MQTRVATIPAASEANNAVMTPMVVATTTNTENTTHATIGTSVIVHDRGKILA